MITELILGVIGLAIFKQHKTVAGIGRIKRRIYIEIEAAQNRGVRLDQKYIDLTDVERKSLEDVGHEFGWKQSTRSIASGKTYTEAYYNSLRRAYNAITGIAGIGAVEHRVKDANGNIILRWSAPEEVLEHIEAEKRLEETERRLAKTRANIRRNRRQVFTPAPNLQAEEPANENSAYIPQSQKTILNGDQYELPF